MSELESIINVDEEKYLGYKMRDPKPEELETPEFNIIWDCIKKWDISTDGGNLYSGATGNHVVAILDALRKKHTLHLFSKGCFDVDEYYKEDI